MAPELAQGLRKPKVNESERGRPVFLGYVELESQLNAPVLILDSARTPINLDALPTVRVYGPLGILPDVTAVATFLDTGSITGATNATPIVITSPNHELTTGTYVTVAGVLGNTAANGSTTVTVIDNNTFSLDGSVGNGNYVSGGTWNVTGFYLYELACTSVNGFEVATTYYVLIQGSVAGVQTADQQTFIVT
jgi:hypothetical protein